MFKSSTIINNIEDIPSVWIFENYLNVEHLTGQNVKIKSVFNHNDTNPSLSIFYSSRHQKYMYKCFSTGSSGDGFDLMSFIWGLDFGSTFNQIKLDYMSFLESGGKINNIIYEGAEWKLKDYKVRKWNINDRDYWSQYNINSKLLEKYNVVPISEYTMFRKINKEFAKEEAFITIDEHIYGFLTAGKVLYKIYRPKTPKNKFMNISNHLQGGDQLERNDVLIIASSLKDIISLKSLKLNIDAVAPASENTMLGEKVINSLKERYRDIVVLFDSDDPGVKSMKKYKETYDLPFIYLPLSKDISDSIRDFGPELVTTNLIIRINNTINIC